MPANLVFRLKFGGARDNGIPPRSTPDVISRQIIERRVTSECYLNIVVSLDC